ncbi:hypothetical protein HK100_002532, partial [Physocladia obscura]
MRNSTQKAPSSVCPKKLIKVRFYRILISNESQVDLGVKIITDKSLETQILTNVFLENLGLSVRLEKFRIGSAGKRALESSIGKTETKRLYDIDSEEMNNLKNTIRQNHSQTQKKREVALNPQEEIKYEAEEPNSEKELFDK